MYIGFLVNGRLAMVFETEKEAYIAFHSGGLGLVGKLVDNGKVEVLYKYSGYLDNSHHVDSYYYFGQKIEDRLEITNPDHFIIKRVKSRIAKIKE